MNVWYFHGQYKASASGTNKIYSNFDLHHVSNVAVHFQKKKKILICLFKCTNEESQENEKY